MDVAELIPGLLRAMEARLGRFGRLFTTVLTAMLGIAITAWAARLTWDSILEAALNWLGIEFTLPGILQGGVLLIMIPASLAILYFTFWAFAYGLAILIVVVLNRLMLEQNRRDREALDAMRSSMLTCRSISAEDREALENLSTPPLTLRYQEWWPNFHKWGQRIFRRRGGKGG